MIFKALYYFILTTFSRKKYRVAVSEYFTKAHFFSVISASDEKRYPLIFVTSYPLSPEDKALLKRYNVPHFLFFPHKIGTKLQEVIPMNRKMRIVSCIRAFLLKLVFCRPSIHFIVVDDLTYLTCGLVILDRWLNGFIKVVYLPHGIHHIGRKFSESKILYFGKLPKNKLYKKYKFFLNKQIVFNDMYFTLCIYRFYEAMQYLNTVQEIEITQNYILFMGGFEESYSFDTVMKYYDFMNKIRDKLKEKFNFKDEYFIYRPHPSEREIFFKKYKKHLNWDISNSTLSEDLLKSNVILSLASSSLLEASQFGKKHVLMLNPHDVDTSIYSQEYSEGVIYLPEIKSPNDLIEYYEKNAISANNILNRNELILALKNKYDLAINQYREAIWGKN
ncbi:hypothetical protein QEJ31_04370 [Pigmentibacter sp. JX0631]|uniref:hypothetical protein n=1 Tax=Pigmentibacter sp. JX0631 TaxID=2976982 RepID=UPI0024691B96|nr:hypothetical protein [Pigmentibacter sp. JX0631]WGL60831.1 hypothetical protein QEJ31_04370 [Pigmentibacter sp. JX0631]